MGDEQTRQVQLTDLQVIQQFSLAVRGATADRDAVVAALEADLEWLSGGKKAPAKSTRSKKA